MTALEVIHCLPGASVQDAGRFGFRRFGVSTAGAMDRNSLALANALVGNPWDAAAIELSLAGASFLVCNASALVAICGPGSVLAISGRMVPDCTSALAEAGDTITVGPPRDGVYSYMAVAGEIDANAVLGSRSFHSRTGIGGSALAPGDRLECRTLDRPPMCFPGSVKSDTLPVRVVPGPQCEAFGDVWPRFLSSPYRISPRSDRMGLRLEGPGLRSSQGHDILSEGVVTGSIQVPGDLMPIVLGRDCQTTGGYPKIATVISADFDRLAQMQPGREVWFEGVSEQEAFDAARLAAEWRDTLRRAMLPAKNPIQNLHQHNLIDGVTRGDES